MPLRLPANQVPDPAVWAESWSGWCLDRTSPAPLPPWTVPAIGAKNKRNIDGVLGAIRLWFNPAWDSASVEGGAGPGAPATLFTLAVTNATGSAPVLAVDRSRRR